jgi:hypothetical protein
MLVQAAEVVRRMRGGAQAWLLRGCDEAHYVVKFRENAQHPRILINEWLASRFLLHLQLCAAQPVLVQCTDAWLQTARNEGLQVQVGRELRQVSSGFHFGARVPVNPNTTAIYDFLPDGMFERLENRRHFHGLLVFDQWVSNADTRQAVYFRARLKDFLRDTVYPPAKLGLMAMMIDHGYAFQGPEWVLRGMPRQGLYPRPVAYQGIASWDDLEPWLTGVMHFPESAVDEACKSMPSSWFEDDDEAQLEVLLEQLMRRAKRIPDLLSACRNAQPDLFPNWTSHQVGSSGTK